MQLLTFSGAYLSLGKLFWQSKYSAYLVFEFSIKMHPINHTIIKNDKTYLKNLKIKVIYQDLRRTISIAI